MPIGVERLKKRADFLRVASVRRKWAAPGLVLQAACDTAEQNTGRVRVGFTVTKKVGNSVIRNRVKRRLRAVAQDVIPGHAIPGWDYVLIGRQMTINRDFRDLQTDLRTALKKVTSPQNKKIRGQS
ncbi:ribonuclease P protein component [Sneathiella marina]|uniref:Ribonuclease P protein component n=1 Tax=Sneathiella marina TaxID=2950108 RepID=A0ABY4W3J1_9PROT|nr:ribonuclease P protein component [Sneathiella marina]USG61760.1 ribonuclease P protein component [Sneathiella marina]